MGPGQAGRVDAPLSCCLCLSPSGKEEGGSSWPSQEVRGRGCDAEGTWEALPARFPKRAYCRCQASQGGHRPPLDPGPVLSCTGQFDTKLTRFDQASSSPSTNDLGLENSPLPRCSWARLPLAHRAWATPADSSVQLNSSPQRNLSPTPQPRSPFFPPRLLPPQGHQQKGRKLSRWHFIPNRKECLYGGWGGLGDTSLRGGGVGCTCIQPVLTSPPRTS